MDMINLTLADGRELAFPVGTKGRDIAEAIAPDRWKRAVAVRIGDRIIDYHTPVTLSGPACPARLVELDSDDGLEVLRHSTAHIMADAVKRLFPTAQITIGPAIDTGFYYDFGWDRFTPEDLAKIEAEMTKTVKANHPFRREVVARDEAIAMFRAMGETYKCEIIGEIPAGEPISLYRHGDFVDVCRGPHLPFAGYAKAFKLTHVSGAYWRGDEKNPMLQRIYGTAFATKEALATHLERVEEAKRRDHRRIGQALGLFMFHEWAPGAPFWLPHGTTLYNTLAQAMRTLVLGEGYVEVKTPLLFNKALWERSGHWEKFREHMFVFDGNHKGTENPESNAEILGLKAMNCPSHMLIFGSQTRSYRDLPLRLHDQGVLHRNEPSGTLSGLTRVRQFAQDDAHIYLPESEIGPEIARLLRLVDRVYSAFGMTYTANLSTRSDACLGDVSVWERAEAALKAALEESGKAYAVKAGEGAFYGPKIDFDISDSLGRKWQCATIQVDFVQPNRFALKYVGDDGKDHTPVVIHRALFGSFERFIAMLIEHYAGAFPTWLAPVQATVITVGERHETFAREVTGRLAASGVRVDLDLRPEKLGYKIRQAQLMQVPYMLVIGDKEVEARAVAPRPRRGDPLPVVPLDEFVSQLAKEAKLDVVFGETKNG